MTQRRFEVLIISGSEEDIPELVTAHLKRPLLTRDVSAQPSILLISRAALVCAAHSFATATARRRFGCHPKTLFFFPSSLPSFLLHLPKSRFASVVSETDCFSRHPQNPRLSPRTIPQLSTFELFSYVQEISAICAWLLDPLPKEERRTGSILQFAARVVSKTATTTNGWSHSTRAILLSGSGQVQ